MIKRAELIIGLDRSTDVLINAVQASKYPESSGRVLPVDTELLGYLDSIEKKAVDLEDNGTIQGRNKFFEWMMYSFLKHHFADKLSEFTVGLALSNTDMGEFTPVMAHNLESVGQGVEGQSSLQVNLRSDSGDIVMFGTDNSARIPLALFDIKLLSGKKTSLEAYKEKSAYNLLFGCPVAVLVFYLSNSDKTIIDKAREFGVVISRSYLDEQASELIRLIRNDTLKSTDQIERHISEKMFENSLRGIELAIMEACADSLVKFVIGSASFDLEPYKESGNYTQLNEIIRRTKIECDNSEPVVFVNQILNVLKAFGLYIEEFISILEKSARRFIPLNEQIMKYLQEESAKAST